MSRLSQLAVAMSMVAPGLVIGAAFAASGSSNAAVPVPAPGTTTANARYLPGSGFYLLNVNNTDGIKRVGGWVKFTQAGTDAPILVTGTVRNLRPSTSYVAVPYKDSICAPIVGITAFPSGSFTTNSNGVARIPVGTSVNPAGINPAGSINVPDTKSISIRRVLVSAQSLPPVPGYPQGLPAGTPNVPNGAAVEACDRTPVLRTGASTSPTAPVTPPVVIPPVEPPV